MEKKSRQGVASNSLLLMIVRIISTLLGLIVTKLLSVHFSLSEYGTYSQALLITGTATSISILGLTDATNFFYNRSRVISEQRVYISTVFTIQYIVGTFCACVIILFRSLISVTFGNAYLEGVLLIVAFTPALTNLLNMYQTLFVAIGEARKIAARNFIVSVIRLIAVILACYVFHNIVTVLIVILVLDVGQVLYFSTMFKTLRWPIKIRNANYALVKEILIFSIPMAIFVMTNSLSRDIDKYVISAFSNTETLAIYTNASKILPFDLLTSSLITVLIPIITRYIQQKNFPNARNVFKLYLRTGYLLTTIFVGGAIAVARYLMYFLYDEKYIAGLSVFIVYLVVDMVRFANVTTVLSGAGKTKVLMYISCTMLVLNLFLNVIGYKIIGILGPAIVTLFLTISMTILLLHFGAREIQTSFIKLFDFREMTLIVIEITILGAIEHFLAQFLFEHGVTLFFTLAVSYGSYLILILGLNYRRIHDCYKALNSYT